MGLLTRVSSLAVALVLLTLGLWHATRSTPIDQREPRLSATLKPLINAPIPVGSEVLFAFPHSGETDKPLTPLFEAAWLRPDLRWAAWEGEGSQAQIIYLVSLDARVVPSNWRETWRQGALVLYRRELQ
jgi:hypothetical protein